MFQFATPPLEIIARTAIVYVFLLAGLRILGKREVGQLNPFDLVLILVISNAVQNAMLGPDNSLVGGLVAAATLLLVNFLISQIRERSRRAENLLVGHATLLVNDGQMLTERMRHEGLGQEEIFEAMREHGIDELSKVKAAILEVDGTISIIPEDSKPLRTRRKVRFVKHH